MERRKFTRRREVYRIEPRGSIPRNVQFDYTYLVPSGSPIRSIADADRTDGHIATLRGHAAAIQER
jgi:hypothetical protein